MHLAISAFVKYKIQEEDSEKVCYECARDHYFFLGAEELDQGGCGLSVRDAVMERIFTVDTTLENPVSNVKEPGSSARSSGGGAGHSGSMGGEKEEGEVGDHGEEGEGERYKFWVKVDIFNVDE